MKKIFLLYLVLDETLCENDDNEVFVGVFDSEDGIFEAMRSYGVIDDYDYNFFKPRWTYKEIELNKVDEDQVKIFGLGKL